MQEPGHKSNGSLPGLLCNFSLIAGKITRQIKTMQAKNAASKNRH
tara:strand:+ start:240 stop:374 length:135 start_codon:yes stop_codon:yes gene_type:complete